MIISTITRKDYMEKRVSHEEYFTYIANECKIKLPDRIIVEVKAALEYGDKHLNSIPLREWDNMATSGKIRYGHIISKIDNGWSLAAGVCVLKQAAKNQAMKIEKTNTAI